MFVAAGNIANVSIVPGYGISYTESGVAKSAKIPDIASNNTEYINTLQALLNSSAIGF